MPRPNQERTINAERRLAERIATERAARGWTLERMADAMTEAGCSIRGSAIFRIEKGDPPRRVTVDELVAISRMWAIPVERLVQ